MREFSINNPVHTLSFDSDGIYTVGAHLSSGINYFDISDSELTTLKENIKKVNFPQIVDDDVIYFDKNAAFPKLLLGRLDLKVKRTIKIDKANKIVVNRDSILTSNELNLLEFGYIIFVGGTGEEDCNQIFFISSSSIKESEAENISLDLMQKYFPGVWKKAMCVDKKIASNALDLINSVPEKITTVQNVAIYLNSQLATLDADSAKTMISLFKAGSEEKKLAVNMITSFNISTVLYDICEAIGESTSYFDQATKSSINYKYFKLLTGIDLNDLDGRWRYGTYYQNRVIADLFHNPLMSPDQKLKAWNAFNKNIQADGYTSSNKERVLRQFNSYHMPLQYDPERETSTGNSEVEGS